ncbi:MAG: hypothetical protein KC766_35990 [Myxococcales bacterium]|nr:hypothetical protein [Myxococcales bacterium]
MFFGRSRGSDWRRGGLLVLLLCGCASRPSAVPPAAPIRVDQEPPTVLPEAPRASANPALTLEPDYTSRFKDRASLAVAGQIYFEPDGPALVEAERTVEVPLQLVVVERHERHLRVALADGGAVVLVYVPRHDFASRVTREARLLVDPLPKADRRAGVFLRPGARVEVRARTTKYFRVEFEDSDLRCDGYLPKPSLGLVYQPQQPALGSLELEADSEFSLAPGGPPLGCEASPEVRLVRELDRMGDFSLVEYASSDLRLVGWVRSARVHHASRAGSVKLAETGGYGRGADSAPRVSVRTGAAIYDARGDQVGRVVRSVQLPVIARGESRSELSLSLPPWGDVAVWVATADLTPSSEDPGDADAGAD